MIKEDLFVLFAILLIITCAFITGGMNAYSRFERDAVKANVAYWTVDENGISKFHWITE
jgi:hypothetical protein